jgi:uncharacterized protein YjbI with pentapeptide repeats
VEESAFSLFFIASRPVSPDRSFDLEHEATREMLFCPRLVLMVRPSPTMKLINAQMRRVSKIIASVVFLALTVLVIRLRPWNQSTSISGTLLDVTGSHLDDALVILKLVDEGPVIADTRSNNEGLFVFSGIRPATYTLHISRPNFGEVELTNVVCTAKRPKALGPIILEMLPPDELTIAEASPAAGKDTPSISGEVGSNSGHPLSDATVTMTAYGSAATQQIKTDDKGLFVFTRLPLGLYNIRVFSQGFATYSAGRIPTMSGKNSSVGRIGLSVASGSSASLRTDTPQNGSNQTVGPSTSGNLFITGMAVDSTEKPVPGAIVHLSANSDPAFVIQRTSDETGRFTFNQLHPGYYVIEISAPGFHSLTVKNIELQNFLPLAIGRVKLQATPVPRTTPRDAPTLGLETIEVTSEAPDVFVRKPEKPKDDILKILKDHESWISSHGAHGAIANLRRADLNLNDLRGFTIMRANFAGADLTNADLSQTNAEGAVLTGADLSGANLSKANLKEAELSEAVLLHASLNGANLTHAYMLAAEMSQAELTNGIMSQSFMSGVNLKGAKMVSSDLQSSDLTSAGLVQANLTGANLEGAVLEGADLSQANLARAKLTNATLINANLREARLTGAELTGVKMTQADVSQTVFEPRTLPDIREMATVKNLELISYAQNPDALAELQARFKVGGYREQERKITYALKHREAKQLQAHCDLGLGLLNCVAFWFNTLFFDMTCQYGMAPGRPLELGFVLWFFCSLLYAGFIHNSGKSALHRIYPADILSGSSAVQTAERIKSESPEASSRLPKVLRALWRELSVLRTAMFFSLMCAFNIGFRDINFGRWLRLLTRRKYDIEASGWVRVIAGWQSLLSVYLVALWVLTYFGRPFE